MKYSKNSGNLLEKVLGVKHGSGQGRQGILKRVQCTPTLKNIFSLRKVTIIKKKNAINVIELKYMFPY